MEGMTDVTVQCNCQTATLAVQFAVRPKVETEVDTLVKNGVLEPVTTNVLATPIIPVPKKNREIQILR